MSTHDAFEKFAAVVARAALPDASWRSDFQPDTRFSFLTGDQSQNREPDILLSNDSRGMRAVGDAKYKEVLEWAANEGLDTSEEMLRGCIQTNDWNQLYVYMQMTKATCGFFIVPFWNAQGQPTAWLDKFKFDVSPCDGAVRVAVLALNLLRPLKEVKQAAANKLREWLSA